MGRTNYILLALGLVSTVLLSMMMQHLLRVHKDTKQSPIVSELVTVFGSRMAGEPSWSVDGTKDSRHGLLTVHVLAGFDRARIARELGDHVWRRAGADEGLTQLQIRCIDELDGGAMTFTIAKPLLAQTSRPSDAQSMPKAGPR